LKWRLLSTLLLLHSAGIKIQEAKDYIDEEDPRPTSSNGVTSSCPQIHNWKKFTIAKPKRMIEINKEIIDTIQKILTLTRIYYLKIIFIKVNSIYLKTTTS